MVVCLLTCWACIAGRVAEALTFHFPIAHRNSNRPAAYRSTGIRHPRANISREMWQLRSLFIGYARRWDEREQMIQRAKSQGLPYGVVLR